MCTQEVLVFFTVECSGHLTKIQYLELNLWTMKIDDLLQESVFYEGAISRDKKLRTSNVLI